MKVGFVSLKFALLCLWALSGLGCGSTQQREATEQLLTSNAVDRSVAQIDFRALSGKSVYFDTTYLKNVKNVGFVNAEYITSSLRQQLVAARCLLKDDKKEAEYVVEARIGVLGTDRHEVTYGMPANNFLSAASSLVPNSPPLPTIPELALAKRNDQLAAAKIGAFAYHRETGEPVWQSGISAIRSTAKDTWLLGAGPFQRGEIYGGTQFAGTKLGFAFSETGDERTMPLVDYHKPAYFALHQKPEQLAEVPADSENKPASDTPAELPPKPEPDPDPKPDPDPDSKSEPEPQPEAVAPTAETAAEPAVAESKTPPPPAPPANVETPPHPLESAIDMDSGLRLRFHFDEPAPDDGHSQLFRLDPQD